MDVYVEKIEDGLLKWKIPCFPVMEVEFKHAWVRINGQRQKILLSKDSSRLKCPVNVRCTSHCNITIESEIVLVMWTYKEIGDTTSAELNDPEQLDLVPIYKHSNVTHTLPFKVMGVAYSKEAQDHLEAAYEHLYVAKKKFMPSCIQSLKILMIAKQLLWQLSIMMVGVKLVIFLSS